MDTRDFAWALRLLKNNGARMERDGWNGKGMWVAMHRPCPGGSNTLPYLYIEHPVGSAAYPQGARVPWLASQTDLLAEDWREVVTL